MQVAHVSTFTPTQCGIATYTEFLIDHSQLGAQFKVRMRYYCDENLPGTMLDIVMEDRHGYAEAAAVINESAVDIVSLQHEFAIFGGKDGEFLLDLGKLCI